jgi:hypothetical protein
MGSGFTQLFDVHIEFSQSHLVFPAIVGWVLVVLFAAIVVVYGPGLVREFRSGKRSLSLEGGDFDKFRFPATIALTIAYFQSMEVVGGFFPNKGFGFLIMSIPVMFLFSLLFVHGLTARKLVVIGLNAVILPSVAWYVLKELFRVSLP